MNQFLSVESSTDNQKNELFEKLSTTEYVLDKLIDDWDLKREWNVK